MTTPNSSTSSTPPDGADDAAYDAYLDALERGSAQEVDAFLDDWPGASADLRARLIVLRGRLGRGSARPAEIGGMKVTRRLGRGGMGEVLLAYDATLDRYVALKMLISKAKAPASRIERLRQEARTLAALDHPNVATVHQFGLEDASTPHIVMEYVEGRDLAAALHDGPLSWKSAVSVLVQVAAALAAAHDRRIIHRDLKPSNIMLRPDGRVKVLDFGLSSRLNDAPHEDSATRGSPASPEGTPGYMSPEHKAGTHQDERSDVWAFGCVAHELLTGRRTSRTHPLDFPSGAPAALIDLVTRCLAHDRDRRPANGGVLFAELSSLHGSGAGAPLGPPAIQAARTSFIDGTHQLKRLVALLSSTSHPGSEQVPVGTLITLIGPAGVGKSRLALEAARGAGATYLVELAGCVTSTVDLAILRSLGLSLDQQSSSAVDAAAAHLAEIPGLLVLDNCEHVLDAIAAFTEGLLKRLPTARILATSREPLGIRGEAVHSVLPLDKLRDASLLFIDRARTAGCLEFQPAPNGELDPRAMESTHSICRQLDGLPLAIELAAAQASRLGLATLAERVHELDVTARPLRAETSQPDANQAAKDRHESITSAIQWSVDLLEPAESELLQRLGLFRRGWSLRSLEGLVQAEGTNIAVLPLLSRLTLRSLVVREPHGSRWRLLETVRAFAEGQLMARPEVAARARHAHARTLLAVGQRAAAASFGPERAAAFGELEADLEDFLAALNYALAVPQLAADFATTTGELFEFWLSRGFLEVGQEALTRTLEAAGPQTPRSLPPRSLPPGSLTPGRQAQCHLTLGTIAQRRGHPLAARKELEEALRLAQLSQDPSMIAKVIRNLAFFALSEGDLVEAERGLRAALEMAAKVGDPLRLGNLNNDIGILHNYQGRYPMAADAFARGLRLRQEAGCAWGIASSLGNLGEVQHRLGHLRKARTQLAKSVGAFSILGDIRSVAESLEMSSSLEVTSGDYKKAARLAGAAAKLREDQGFPKPEAERAGLQASLDAIEAQLGAERFEGLCSEGADLELAEAIQLAQAPGFSQPG